MSIELICAGLYRLQANSFFLRGGLLGGLLGG